MKVTKEERVHCDSSVEGSVPDDGELEEAGSWHNPPRKQKVMKPDATCFPFI